MIARKRLKEIASELWERGCHSPLSIAIFTGTKIPESDGNSELIVPGFWLTPSHCVPPDWDPFA